MAVDKSFVVKNGLEVNSDLIVTDISDSQNKKVGIASTGPRTTLDVRGGIAATDGNFTGILTAASVDISNFGAVNGTQATITGFSTLGGLTVDQLTVSGVATFADLSYDEITGRNINITGIATIPVFVGVTSFNDGVTVAGVVTATSFRGDGSQLTGGGVGVADSTGTVIGYGFTMLNFIGAGNTFAVDGTSVDISIAGGGGGGGGSASIGIGTTVGDAFSGIVTAGNLWYNTGEGRLFIYYQDADSAQWVDAAPFNVGIITTLQGQIDFSAGSASAPSLTFSNDGDSGFFQAATNQPGVSAAGSQVARFNPGGVTVTGVVTATSFSGDGSGLTGVASTDNIQTATPANFLSDVSITGVTTVGVVTGGTSISAGVFYGDGSALTGIDATRLTDSGGSTIVQANSSGAVVTGVLTATTGSFSGNVTIGGTLTYQDVENIDSIGIITAQQGIQVLANGANITGIVTVGLSTIKSGEIDVLGIVTATTFKAGTAISITDGAVSATRFHGSGADLTGISAIPVIGTDTSSPNNQFVFLDLDNAQDHKLIVSGITTISCTGGKEGDSHTVRITNSGITTIGFTTAFLFPSGASPSMPTADGALSLISFTINKAGTAGTELFTGASLNFS